MPRRRTPSTEQQRSDRFIIAKCTDIVATLAQRYPGTVLEVAERCLHEFAKSPVVERKRHPKPVKEV